MSQKYEKLKSLLQEMFQLDQPDLDFGLYRVMHAKSAEVSRFLTGSLHNGGAPGLRIRHAARRRARHWRGARDARLRTAAVCTSQPDQPQPRTTTRSKHK
jgi:hypothetical protein